MAALLTILVLAAVGVAQLWSIVAVANAIGVVWTAGLMVLCVVVGLWLVARQGASVARRAQSDLAAGRPPTRVVADGLLVLIAGGCLLVPGFVTATVGFLLLLPPTRALVRPLVDRWWSRRVARGGAFAGASGGPAGPFGATVFRTVVIGDVPPARGTRRGPVVDGGVGGGGAAEDGVIEAEVVDVRVERPRELPPGS